MQSIHSQVQLTSRKLAVDTKLKSREKGRLETSVFEQPDPVVSTELILDNRKAQAAFEASTLCIDLVKLGKAMSDIQAE